MGAEDFFFIPSRRLLRFAPSEAARSFLPRYGHEGFRMILNEKQSTETAIHRKGGAAFHLYARRQGCLPHHLMRNGDDGPQGKGEHDDGLLHFSLPGLLRDNHTLVLNPAMRTASLLYIEVGGGARIVTQEQFSPNGMRVLLSLLQAYPDYCPYEVLLTSLFPLSLEAAHKQLQEEWEVSIRPVRAAIASIGSGLRSFGLSVYSLRGLGYILRPL